MTNAVTFGNNASNNQIGVNVDTATFGTLNFASGDSRAFQFSGRFTFQPAVLANLRGGCKMAVFIRPKAAGCRMKSVLQSRMSECGR